MRLPSGVYPGRRREAQLWALLAAFALGTGVLLAGDLARPGVFGVTLVRDSALGGMPHLLGAVIMSGIAWMLFRAARIRGTSVSVYEGHYRIVEWWGREYVIERSDSLEVDSSLVLIQVGPYRRCLDLESLHVHRIPTRYGDVFLSMNNDDPPGRGDIPTG
jgi:hypothetical protein